MSDRGTERWTDKGTDNGRTDRFFSGNIAVDAISNSLLVVKSLHILLNEINQKDTKHQEKWRERDKDALVFNPGFRLLPDLAGSFCSCFA